MSKKTLLVSIPEMEEQINVIENLLSDKQFCALKPKTANALEGILGLYEALNDATLEHEKVTILFTDEESVEV